MRERRRCYDCEEVEHISKYYAQNKCNERGQQGHVAADWPKLETAALVVQDVRLSQIHRALVAQEITSKTVSLMAWKHRLR